MRLTFFNIFIFIFCIFSIPSLAYAKNLGVWGPLFPIEEQDIREFIYQRLNASSAKSVGHWWLFKFPKLMIQGYLQAI